MDLEELKKSWKKTDAEIDKIIKVNEDLTDICRNKNMGLRDKIMNKHKVLCVLSFVMTFICIFLLPYRNFHPALTITLIIYFIVLGLLDLDIYKRLKRIDYKSMSVKTMLISTTEFIIKRSHYQIIGYCMMIPLIIILLLYFHSVNMGMFYGGCFGGVVGMIAGLYADFKIKKQIKTLKENLEKELEDEPEDIEE